MPRKRTPKASPRKKPDNVFARPIGDLLPYVSVPLPILWKFILPVLVGAFVLGGSYWQLMGRLDRMEAANAALESRMDRMEKTTHDRLAAQEETVRALSDAMREWTLYFNRDLIPWLRQMANRTGVRHEGMETPMGYEEPAAQKK